MIKRLIWYPLIRLSSVLRWLVQLGTIVLILLSFRSGPFWSSERSKPIHKLTVAEQNLQTDLRFDLQSFKTHPAPIAARRRLFGVFPKDT